MDIRREVNGVMPPKLSLMWPRSICQYSNFAVQGPQSAPSTPRPQTQPIFVVSRLAVTEPPVEVVSVASLSNSPIARGPQSKEIAGQAGQRAGFIAQICGRRAPVRAGSDQQRQGDPDPQHE